LVDYRLGLTSNLRLTNPVAHDAQHRALADGRKGAHPQALLQELARGAVTQRLVQALVVVQLSVTKPM
jgi:hypothetical protein